MTTTTTPETRARRPASPLPAVAGLLALAASAGATVLFGDPMAGSDSPADAAAALAGSSAQPAALLVGIYALLALAVAGSLAARLGNPETGATRLIPVLAAAHLLLMTLFMAAPAAAVTVGTLVLDGGVSPVGAEAALLLMNVVHPVAGWFGAGFLVAVAIAAHRARASWALVVVTSLFALGLLIPPVAWIVTYLMGLWFAGVGIWLWLRR